MHVHITESREYKHLTGIGYLDGRKGKGKAVAGKTIPYKRAVPIYGYTVIVKIKIHAIHLPFDMLSVKKPA